MTRNSKGMPQTKEPWGKREFRKVVNSYFHFRILTAFPSWLMASASCLIKRIKLKLSPVNVNNNPPYSATTLTSKAND